eukprot:Lankesteria_metandrocarpae@DN5902_c0_g1_i1.p1
MLAIVMQKRSTVLLSAALVWVAAWMLLGLWGGAAGVDGVNVGRLGEMSASTMVPSREVSLEDIQNFTDSLSYYDNLLLLMITLEVDGGCCCYVVVDVDMDDGCCCHPLVGLLLSSIGGVAAVIHWW